MEYAQSSKCIELKEHEKKSSVKHKKKIIAAKETYCNNGARNAKDGLKLLREDPDYYFYKKAERKAAEERWHDEKYHF